MTARRWARSGVAVLVGAAAVLWGFVLDEPVTGLLLLVVAGLIWGTGPGFLGRPRTDIRPGLDPRQVKQYRREHPGTTITDAAAAVSRQVRGG